MCPPHSTAVFAPEPHPASAAGPRCAREHLPPARLCSSVCRATQRMRIVFVRPFANQALEAAPPLGARAGLAQALIDHQHLLFAPAESSSPVAQPVLQARGLLMVPDLLDRRRSDIDDRQMVTVTCLNLFVRVGVDDVIGAVIGFIGLLLACRVSEMATGKVAEQGDRAMLTGRRQRRQLLRAQATAVSRRVSGPAARRTSSRSASLSGPPM